MRTSSRARGAAALVGGSALLAGSWLLARSADELSAGEARAFRSVNGLPDQLWPVVWAPMQAGSFGGSIALAGAALAVTRRPRLAAAALAGSQAAYWASKVIKRATGRGRPHVFLPDVHRREHASGLGYVSGHSAVAVALATVVVPATPARWRPVVVGGAGFVGVARQYAGVHLPLDIIGGIGLGLVTGTAARWTFRAL